MMSDLVIGLGEIGAPLLEVLEQADPHIQGLDLEPVDIKQPVDMMHVCIPFGEQESFVQMTADYAARFQPQIIVIHSTVTPGTTRAIEKTAERPSVFSPVRGKHHRMVEELRHYRKFVASTDASARQRVTTRFADAGMPSEAMNKPETLELAKLMETTYFGMLIGWTQEMNRYAESASAELNDMHAFFAEVSYLPPKAFVPGYIGGHCVMPNINLLRTLRDSPWLDTLVASNEQRRTELGIDPESESGKDRQRVEPRELKR